MFADLDIKAEMTLPKQGRSCKATRPHPHSADGLRAAKRLGSIDVPEILSPPDQRRAGLVDRLFTAAAGSVSGAAGKPWALATAISGIAIWGAGGWIFGYSDTWQLLANTVTSIITFLMVFLIQNSQNRDAAAMQAKLDELIRAAQGARDQFIGIEHLTADDIEMTRMDLERAFAGMIPALSAEETMRRMQNRL